MNFYVNYLALAIPVGFAYGVRIVFSNWLSTKLRQRAARRRAANGSMAMRESRYAAR